MEDTMDIIVPENPSNQALVKISAILGEHFEHYLICAQKNGKMIHNYNSKTTAYGMASFIISDIHQDWVINKNTGKKDF